MSRDIILNEDFGEFSGKKIVEMISEEKIQNRIKAIAEEISLHYKNEVPILIGVLNGCFVFMSDLFRELDINAEVDFIKISSYQNETKSSGTVRLLKDISCDITGRDVLVVEDIIDTGLSMSFLKKRLEGCNTKSVKFATLLIKEHTKTDFEIDFIGFKIPDDYVVGYGLDLAQKLRNLKSIYKLIQ